ncbi:MAG: glycosyltransferase family 39 protein [Acetatifactor sp.]|nr:glycosyltransferase family 39 protein [Acetatifactor sp.]
MMKHVNRRNLFRYVSLGILTAMILFLHFYKLTEIPYGMYVDEVGSAYDAYSIANYGVDRYIKSYPVYFTNYGDGQNALYTYITALFFRLFGASKLTVRMGIALSSLTAAFFGYLYACRKWKGQEVPLLFLCLYAILPVFTMTQRFGLESHLMLSASITVLYTTARALETEKWQYYLLAGIVMGLSLYTYALMYIVLPLYLLLWLGYGIRLGKIRLRKLLLLLLPLGLLAAPLLMVQIINAFSLPEMRLGPFTLTRLEKYRSAELGFQDLFRNLKQMFTNTLFFDNLTYNTFSRYGTLYYISLPFLFIGLVKTARETWLSWRQKQLDYAAPVLFWLLGEFVMGCILKGWSTPNTTRMIGIFIAYLYLITAGICRVWNCLKKIWQKRAFGGILASLYAVSFLSFAHYYFTDYNQLAYPMNWLFYETYDDIPAFLEEHRDQSWASRGVCYPSNYMYYLWSFRVSPYDVNIPVNGIQTFGKDSINEFPEKILVRNNYVVSNLDQPSIEFLTQIGYIPVQMDKHIFFICPFENYDVAVSQEQLFYLDNIHVLDQDIKFFGWCVDPEADAPFAGYLLEIDGAMVDVQKTPRTDVAGVLGREDYLESGFTAIIPLDTLGTCNSLTLTGVRADGSQSVIYQILRKEKPS